MPKIRVGQDEHTYYIGFEPPLEPAQLQNLPNPFGSYAGCAEIAGWPSTAVVTRPQAQETIIGLYKESLYLATIHKKSSAAEDENAAAKRLADFLGEVATVIEDSAFDTRIYDVAVEAGALSFIAASKDNVLGL